MAESAAQPVIPQAGRTLNLIPVGYGSPITLLVLQDTVIMTSMSTLRMEKTDS